MNFTYHYTCGEKATYNFRDYDEYKHSICHAKCCLCGAPAIPVWMVSELPELTGSEKQVAWATKIREKVRKMFDNFQWPDEQSEEVALLQNAIDELFERHTDSRYWIDNRDQIHGWWSKQAGDIAREHGWVPQQH